MNFASGLTLMLGLSIHINQARGHGRFIEPPSRASLFRFPNDEMIKPYLDIVEPDYNDNQLFCGGFAVYVANDLRCGICGDDFADAKPREHETGGLYAKGIIVREYNQGDEIDVAIDITASHKGYFEFKLCPWNNMNEAPNQDCFEKHLLKFSDGTTRYGPITEVKVYNMKVHLPDDVTCDRCILQWKYRAGNNWGVDDEGEGMGHGPQETYQGCADVTIKGGAGVTTTTSSTATTTTTGSPTTQASTTTAPIPTTTADPDNQACGRSICKEVGNIRFEKPKDRTHFYQCENGVLTVGACPQGTKYKLWKRACK